MKSNYVLRRHSKSTSKHGTKNRPFSNLPKPPPGAKYPQRSRILHSPDVADYQNRSHICRMRRTAHGQFDLLVMASILFIPGHLVKQLATLIRLPIPTDEIAVSDPF